MAGKPEHDIESGWILPTLLKILLRFLIDKKVFFILKMVFIEVNLTEFLFLIVYIAKEMIFKLKKSILHKWRRE